MSIHECSQNYFTKTEKTQTTHFEFFDTTTMNEQRRRRRGRQGKGSTNASERRQKNLLIEFDEGEQWFDYDEADTTTTKEHSKELVDEFRARADAVLEEELRLYREKRKSSDSADDRWVESTIRKGTLKDRIAAMSVVVAQNPIHQKLDGLMQMCCGPSCNTRVAQLAGEALEDLFANTLLPRNRKLISMDRRPLSNYTSKAKPSKKNTASRTLSPRILLLWRFEELIGRDFNMFLQQYIQRTLQSRNATAVEHQRAALRSAVTLLRSVPEGESFLLRLIVDQLSNHEIHSSAAHALLVTIQEHHPAMKPVVARELQQIAHTSRNSSATVYRAVSVLMQMRLRNSTDSALAEQLLDTYFRLFQQATQEKLLEKSKRKDKNDDTSASKLIFALLTGIHRAYPYVKTSSMIAPHTDVLFKLVHTAPNQAARIQALLVLQEIVKKTDRFQRAVYSMIDHLVRTTRTAGWNLLYRTIKDDSTTTRVCSMLKSALIHGSLHGPTSACAIATLYLVNAVGPSHIFRKTLMEPTDSRIVWDASAREPRGALKGHDESPRGNKTSKSSNKRASNDEQVAPIWEVTLLQHHYHPTVRTFATQLGSGSYQYDGDPLRDFSVGSFLDKLAYRNPKQRARDESSSTPASVPVNDPSFVESLQVPDHDQFFHHYFVERAKRKEAIIEQAPKPDIVPLEGDDTDDEEQEFVDSLSSKLLQESAGGAPVDMDDEDFDMDGWDDSDESQNFEQFSSFDDTRVDQDSTGSDDEPLLNEDDLSSSDEEAPQLVHLPLDENGVYASVDDYNDFIEASMNRKRSHSSEGEHNGDDEVEKQKQHSKKRRTKHQLRKK